MLAARTWLSTRHSLLAEAAIIVGFYATYEAARGLVAGARDPALDRAQQIVSLERKMHLFSEASVQEFARGIPGLLGTLSVAYLTLHLMVTASLLLWLYSRRPAAFAGVRTTLIIASALSLVGFLAFPTAPPRIAGIGLSDTVSRGALDLNHGLISSLYNPYAAVPSMHAGYALVVAIAVMRYGRRFALRVAGALYFPFVLLVIVATGNHFFFDAATGVLVTAFGAALAVLLRPRGSEAEVIAIRRREDAGSDFASVERAA
jgi:hypothetical protein